MCKVDLHTHSIASPDGSIRLDDYKKILDNQILDLVAITDHNRIDFALTAQKEIGSNKIIVGEEIETNEGEIIGLFLTELIKPQQTPEATIAEIKRQGGIVYIPHPFETVRKGINKQTLSRIKDDVDIVEIANGRAFFQNFGPEAHTWAHLNNFASCASSDAHRAKAISKTYTIFNELPNKNNLMELCKSARKHYSPPKMLDILAPKLNRLRKALRIL